MEKALTFVSLMQNEEARMLSLRRLTAFSGALALMLACTTGNALAKKSTKTVRGPYAEVLQNRVRPIVAAELLIAERGFNFSANIPDSCRNALATYDRHIAAQTAVLLLLKAEGVPRSARRALKKEFETSLKAMGRIQQHLEDANCRIGS